MTWKEWRTHFERNRQRALPAVPAAAIPLAWRAPLLRSLAKFQLGESGEGRIALGIGFYGMIAERLPAGSMRAALEQICADEQAHLSFHAELFRSQTESQLARLAFRVAWCFVGHAAALTVLLDHRGTLAALDIGSRPAALRLFALVARASAEVTRARPAPCAVRAAS